MSRLIVIGGGIGGLAVALSAAASGNEVVVLERAREFAEIGAGIQLAPNGLHALKLLGVGDRVAGIGVQVDSLRLFDATVDRLINTMSLGWTTSIGSTVRIWWCIGPSYTESWSTRAPPMSASNCAAAVR